MEWKHEGKEGEVMAWQTPKTNWISTDRFNISDYNRIKNNIEYLGEIGNEIYHYFTLADMGDDKTSYAGYWTPAEFNLFESNLEVIKQNFPDSNIGTRKTFFENGPFIDWEELNRIESALLAYYNMASLQRGTIPRLAVRLGNVKGVKS